MVSSNFNVTGKSPPLSLRLQERRKARESRPCPWRTSPAVEQMSTRFDSRPRPVMKPQSGLMRTVPAAPFPFLDLPYDIQVMICSFALGNGKVIRMRSKDIRARGTQDVSKLDTSRLFIVRPSLNVSMRRASHILPTSTTLAKALPFFLPEITRIWYCRNTFCVQDVADFITFTSFIGSKNLGRVRHLQVENEFIYCTGSNELLTSMKSLETLTLFRDDGGTMAITDAGTDDYNSVEWFTTLCKRCPALKRIQFALTPWKVQGALLRSEYLMSKSNMVIWIEAWEHTWDKILLPRRRGLKYKRSWKAAILGSST